MDGLLKAIKNIYSKCCEGVKKLAVSAKVLFAGNTARNGKKAGRAPSAARSSAAVRSVPARVSSAGRSAGRRPRKQSFFERAVSWVTSLKRPVMIAMAAGVAAVIVIPVVLVCTLPKGGEEAKKASAESDENAAAYRSVDFAEPSAAPEPTPEPVTPETVDPSTVSFRENDTGELVPYIQERLMELSYMDNDMATDVYDAGTSGAVLFFQRANEIEATGEMNGETFTKLFSEDAKGYEMSQGMEGTDIEEMQRRLYELDYIESVTGYFGTDTQAAVERFQELNGLAVDGRVGSQTLELLYSEDVKVNYLSSGASGDQVKKYQERLKKLAYLTTDVDGTFGKDTVNAIKRFQERNGLIADGYLGPTTKEMLMSSSAQPNALVIGVSGTDVTNVQERLKELKYLKKVTGYFGSDTESAVKAFQKRNGLTQDGKVGKQTMSVLFSSSAKKAASTSSSTSKGNSSSNKGKGESSSGGSSKPIPEANGANVSSLLSVAQSRLGCKYVRAGKGPDKFDCSGFVYWCLKQIGVNQGYMTSSGWASNGKYPKITKLSDVQAGDIICFKGHVGIAMGGGMMIDAGSGAGCVRTTKLSLSYWQKSFKCAYRVL